MSELRTAASTARDPWGKGSDIEWAREYVEKNVGAGRIIHAALRPSQEAIDTLSTAQIKGLCMLPCFWPHLIITSPCLICCCLNLKKTMAHMVYIITNREVCRIVLDHAPACACGCAGTSGRDTQTLPLQSIVSCQVDRAGQACCGNQMGVDAARINEFGVVYGGKHGRAPNQYYVQDPDQFVRLVNELREANAQQNPTPMQNAVGMLNAFAMATSAPPGYGSPAPASGPAASSGIRVFVALATNPSQFEIIVNFQPHQGLDGLSKLVSDQFHQPGTRYTFSMAEVGATVTDVQAIQANDKLIATKTI